MGGQSVWIQSLPMAFTHDEHYRNRTPDLDLKVHCLEHSAMHSTEKKSEVIYHTIGSLVHLYIYSVNVKMGEGLQVKTVWQWYE